MLLCKSQKVIYIMEIFVLSGTYVANAVGG